MEVTKIKPTDSLNHAKLIIEIRLHDINHAFQNLLCGAKW